MTIRRQLLNLSLAGLIVGCNTANDKDHLKTTSVSQQEIGQTPSVLNSDVSDAGNVFTMQPAAQDFIQSQNPHVGWEAYLKKAKQGSNTYTGQFIVSRKKKVKMNASVVDDTLRMDWNMNGDLNDDPPLKVCSPLDAPVQTVRIAGREKKLIVRKFGYGASYFLVCIRPAEWLMGTIRFNNRSIRAALIDGDMDGKYTQNDEDRFVLDLEGDGKFISKRGWLETKLPIKKQLPIGQRFYEFNFNPSRSTVDFMPTKGMGKVTVKHPEEWKQTSISVYCITKDNSVRLTATGSEFHVPPGDYKDLRITLNWLGIAKESVGISFRTGPVTIKKSGSLSFAVPMATSVVPKVRLYKGRLKVKESLIYTKPIGPVRQVTFRFKGRRSPAPTFCVYNGREEVAHGTMKYG